MTIKEFVEGKKLFEKEGITFQMGTFIMTLNT